jgi:PAS domain S-box-containing protein
MGFFYLANNMTEVNMTKSPFIMIKEEWERTFDAIPDLIAILDEEHNVTRVNQAMADTLGVSPESCIGVKCFKAVHGSNCPPDFCPHSKLLKDGKEHTSEVYEENLGGYFIVTVSPIYDDKGKVAGSVHVARNITNRREMEDNLKIALEAKKNLVKELKRSNKELEQFAYMASHDLQEPLRMVTSFVKLLEKRYKGQLDSNADEYIYYAVDGAERMQKLIKDLLTYSRITSKNEEFELVNLESIVDKSILNLTVSIKENNARITYDALPTIMADPSLITQLFQNLVGNAIKFRAEDEAPEIHVKAEDNGDEWIFQVIDNGIGIDSQHKDLIFEVFQRLHEKNEYPGTGIGLSMCQKIIERHNGDIWVESELGEGSKFCFTIPKSIE